MTLVFNARREFSSKNPKIIAILKFWLPLSFHEDSHSYIVVNLSHKTCKEIEDGLADLLCSSKTESFTEDLVLLLSNLAVSRIHKVRFDENTRILSECLCLMADDHRSIKLRALCSQFFFNVLHKCTKSVAMLNKKAVLEEIRLMVEEGERQIDRLTFDESMNLAPDDKSSQVHLLKTFVNNLRVVAAMVGINLPSN